MSKDIEHKISVNVLFYISEFHKAAHCEHCLTISQHQKKGIQRILTRELWIAAEPGWILPHTAFKGSRKLLPLPGNPFLLQTSFRKERSIPRSNWWTPGPPLNSSWVFTIGGFSIHLLPLQQAVRAGLMEHTLNYQQAAPTDSLFPNLQTEFSWVCRNT